MATFRLYEESPDDISCICGLVEPEIEGILLRYDDEDRKDIERELANDCDKQALLHARGKFFDLVKAKVVRCLSSEEAGKLLEDADTNDKDERTALLSAYVNRWELTPRRVEHRISYDIMEMLSFILGSDVTFPSKLIKESSLSKGSLPGTERNGTDNDLINQLEKDISSAEGPATIEVLSVEGGSQIHSVSFSTSVSGVDEGKEGPDICNKSAETLINPTEPTAPIVDKEQAVPAACTCACHTKEKAQETPVIAPEPIKRVEKRDMATQTGEEVITRTEFEYQSEFVEEKCSENARDIKEIGKWKSGIQDRVRKVEVVQKKEIAELKKQQKIMTEAISELEKANKRKNANVEAVANSQIVGVDDKSDSDVESVWDVPMEQSTPPTAKAERAAPRGPARAEQATRKTRSSTKAEGCAVPESSSTASGTSRKVGIEIIEDDSTEADSSPNTDGNSPQPKRMKYDGGKGRPGRGGARRGRGRGRRPANTLQAETISEEPRVGKEKPKDGNESWSEIDDGSYYDVLEDEAATDTAAESASGGAKEGGKKDGAAVNKGKSGGNGQPKKTGAQKGELPNSSSNDTGGEQSGESDSDRSTYAQMAGEEPWLPAVRNKKNTNAKFRSLKGVKATVHREVYVQGLDLQGASDFTEIEGLLNNYCKKSGVKVVFMKIIPVKYDKSQVGCKLSVLSEDFERVLDPNFWPEFVTVRAWRYKNRDVPVADVRADNDH